MKRVLVFVIVLIIQVMSYSVSLAADPGLTVVSPADGAIIRGSQVTVKLEASDIKIVQSSVPVAEFGKRPELNKPDEGHFHLMLDLQPVVILYNTEPYTFNDVAAGRHQLMVELVNNDHSSLSPPVVRNISFEVDASLPKTGNGPFEWAPTLLTALLLILLIGTRVAGHWPDQRYAKRNRPVR
jgi:hypothetical protein